MSSYLSEITTTSMTKDFQRMRSSAATSIHQSTTMRAIRVAKRDVLPITLVCYFYDIRCLHNLENHVFIILSVPMPFVVYTLPFPAFQKTPSFRSIFLSLSTSPHHLNIPLSAFSFLSLVNFSCTTQSLSTFQACSGLSPDAIKSQSLCPHFSANTFLP